MSTAAPAGVEAGSLDGPSVRVSTSTVVWFGVDIPLTYSCRACGRVVHQDYQARPVYQVYPSPVLCSGPCAAAFVAYLTAPLRDAEAEAEAEAEYE